ncbi:histone-lysine N-methyltransferase trithorax [Bacillus rossius redtenbacheri]|uniref:histone-lysine N-methyltransferase trithorax n=1 Tax=Bacillus rossius redtenbacheri TaxID=93214 RepID=UPI002FDD91DB
MGKFPGKPSKFVNKKRIQVAKCGSEKDNNSAKNAENIYNGLAVFYEVFGSDEQVNDDFHGFTPGEVKEAADFISALNKTRVCKGRKVSRKKCVIADGDQRVEDNSRAPVRQNRKQCFDGGGTEHKAVSPKFKKVKCASISSSALSLNRTFKHDVAKRILNKAKKASHSVSNLTQQDKTNPLTPRKFVLPSRSAHSSRVIKPNKRFLEGEEVFSDVGVDEAGADSKLKKPKLVFEPDDDASEAARGAGESSCVPAAASAASEPEASPPEPQGARSFTSCKLRFIGVKEFGRGVASWPRVGADGDGFKWTGGSLSQPSKSDPERRTFSSGAAPATSPAGSSGSSKVILRKARLKLDSRVSRSEGSFATVSTSNGAATPETVQCSVCGAVRFYKFVKQARKFGVLCCESCRKFVSKMIRLLPGGELGQQRTQLECHNGNGMCRVPSVVRNQQWRSSSTLEWCAYNARCPACWLQMCLRAFTMPPALKRQLCRMLPPDMREERAPGQPPPTPARDLPTQARSKRKAALASLKKMVIQREDTAGEDFRTDKKLQPEKKYVNKKLLVDNKLKVEKKLNVAKKKVQVEKRPLTERAPSDKRAQAEKKLQLEKRLKPKKKNEQNKMDRKNNTQLNHLATTKILKKAAKNLVKVKGDKKEAGEERRRQQLELKGPRVKHVCRSASIVLGQPQATFPLHSRPDKKKLARHAGKVSKSKPWGSKHALQEEDAAARANSTDKCATDVRGPRAQRGSQEAPAQPRESGESGPGDTAPPPSSRKAAKLPVASILPPVARILPLSSGGGGASPQHLICVDFWESYDPEEVCNTGFALVGSEPFHVRAVCFLCGSAGHEKLIHCASCCEPYHMFCVEEGATGVARPLSWTCKRCTVCQGCGRGSGQQVNCQRCHRSYHSECLCSDRSSSRLHSPDRPWVCAACLRCKSCGKPDVTVFVGNLPLCKACFKLRKKGNFCPLCQRCYEDNDFDTKMMECGQCRCWVHAKCEGLSDEKYQVLSYLPESVEFVCRLCSATPPAPWWRAVEEEMKAGYLAVLRGLSKNRKACALFKWSPKKQCAFHAKRIDSQDGAELSDSSLDDVGSTEGRALDQKGEDDPGTTSNSEGTSSAPGSDSLAAGDVHLIPSEQNLPIGEVGRSLVNLRQRFNIKECRVQINYPRPQASLSVPIPAIGRSSDTRVDCTFRGCGSPSKIPAVPMATPSSDSGLGSTDDELKPSLSTEEDPEDATFLSGVPALSRSRTTEACVDGTTVEPEEVPESKRCRCQELQLNANLSSTLLAIKKSVASNDYFSLLKFHEDMEQLVSSTNCPDLLETYHNALREVFPWFDPKSAKVSEKPIINSSSKVDRQEIELIEGDESNPKQADLFVLPEGSEDYYYSGYTVKDVRTCVFCKGVGDGLPTLEGRLLYCGQNEWTHANCALWSAEVFEEIDGSLQNVHVAMSRGRMIRCRLCRKKGASVGCCYRNCIETYHFPCAMKAKCAFMDDKSVYCSAHVEEAIVGKKMALTSDFDLPRSIYVELDRKKKKYVEPQQVRIMIGSLVVENIGDFVPSVSDQKDFIIPMNYSCSRLYWSAVEPWRIVRYNVKVTLKTTVFQPAQDLGQNVTVDHTQGAQLVQQKIADILRWQQQVLQFDEHKLLLPKLKSASVQTDPSTKKIPAETKVARQILDHLLEVVCKDVDDNCLTDPQNTADLLPPELKDAIFEDLPHDLIDGISMQDIFPKLMNSYEDSVALDLKADIYYGAESLKEGKEDLCEEALMDSEVEPVVANVFPNNKRLETMTELGSQTDLWFQNNEAKDSVEERFAKRKDLRRSKSEGIPNSGRHHRSCSLLWNCKLDGSGKRKPSHRASLDDATYVAAEMQRLQERHRELRYRLEGEEGIVAARRKDHGKENKFLPWHGRPLSRIPQLDGAADSSSSGSESESPPHEGTADMVRQRSAYAPATTDDEPVTCSRCHRTYRTINSFERHLSTCNNDLILSTSDSDSENPKSCEEDCGNNRASRDSPQSQARSEDKSPVAPVEEEIVEVRVPSPPPVPETVPEPVVKLPAVVSSPPRPSPPPARVVGRTGRPRGRPSKQRLLAMQQEMMVHTPVQQPQTLLQPPPSVIMQQVQSPNMMASFVDSFQQQTGHNLQYIATIDSHKPPQYITTLDGYVGLPAAGIPMMPQAAVLGTLIQPQCGVMTTEQMVLGPPGGMILGQPMYYGLETIVSNTVMQSSQFVSATMPACD